MSHSDIRTRFVVAGLAAGSLRLAEIYDLYSPRLYRYAVRLLGDACTAEACVAETFSRFLLAIRTHKDRVIICRLISIA
jgi:DNA-directed RNA polymerase specialized sigma24 family protein